MQRLSQEAFDQLATSEEIVTSIETHGVEVAAILQEKWTTRPASPDSTLQADAPNPPDYLGQLFALKDELNTSATALTEADQLHVHQLARLIELREDREAVRKRASDKFSIARRTLDELLGGEGKAFVLAGFEGPTARTPKKLLRQIDLAVPRLYTPNGKLAQHKVAGITVDTTEMASDLEEVAGELRVAQTEFRRMRRVVQASRKEKNRRLEEHRTNNLWTARIVEGYYQLAGETELAERLRPITNRTSRPAPPTPPEESPVPEETAPDNGTPDSAPDEPTPDETQPEEDTGEGLTPLALLANLRKAPSAG